MAHQEWPNEADVLNVVITQPDEACDTQAEQPAEPMGTRVRLADAAVVVDRSHKRIGTHVLLVAADSQPDALSARNGTDIRLSISAAKGSEPVLDRLNPFARLVFTVLLAVPVLISLDWVSALVMLGLEIVVFALAGADMGGVAKRTWPLAIIATIAAVSMALYGRPGGVILWQWWVMTVSQHSLLLATAIFCRILALALAAIVLLGRVDPTLMADALAQIGKLPIRFVLGTLAGVRMLGLMSADWRALGLARRARGLGDHGAISRVLSMAFSLLVMAIRRGTKLATAMQVRGFSADSRHRTWARPSRLGIADMFGLLVTLLVIAISVIAAVRAGTFWFIWTGGLS